MQDNGNQDSESEPIDSCPDKILTMMKFEIALT